MNLQRHAPPRAAALPEPSAGPRPRRSHGGQWLHRVPGFGVLVSSAEVTVLYTRTMRIAAVPPYPWVKDAITEMSMALRRCLIPMMLSIGAFSLGIALGFVGNIVATLGTADRISGGIYTGFMREPSVWVMSMIFAGVAGSAVTADLAARKIREELDALAVLGIDQTRSLVVPRVVGLTLCAPVLGMLTHLWAMTVLYIFTPAYFPSVTNATFIEVIRSFLVPGDLYAFLLKTTMIGALVGIVSCHKGLSAGGGAEGVGRAVNQAVVVMFVGLWVLNGVFNSAFLALFPSVQALRG